MESTRLGNTGLEVSRICLGCMSYGDPGWRPWVQDLEAARPHFVKALEVGMTVVVAPVQYTLIIWGTFYGWIIFGHFPDMWTVLGTMIIVVTGFYIFNRERLLMRI